MFKTTQKGDVHLAAALSPATPPRPLAANLRHSALLVEFIEGGAACLNHRRSAPMSSRRGTLHHTDRGATIPRSSHPGEGRYSIRTEGHDFGRTQF